MKIFLDANVFAFALLEPGKSGEQAVNLLDKMVHGEHEGITSVLVLDEVMWTLIKNKKSHLLDQSIKNIYEMPHLTIENVETQTPLVALEFIKKYNLKPRDAMHCAFMKINGISTIASDDGDFDGVKEIKRIPV